MVTTCAALALWTASGAQADPFGQCDRNSGCRADNFEHTYCFGPSLAGDGFQSAAGYGMSNLVTQTNFTKTYMSSCSSNTDVVFKREDGMSALGDYLCMAFVSGTRKCNRARVRFNGRLLKQKRHKNNTACHEVGHSGGLGHGSGNDCMIAQGPSNKIHYNGHHVTHLNNQN